MKISERLNLVVPIEWNGTSAYVHSVPISLEVFETHCAVVAKTFSVIYGEGIGPLGGPQVARMLLKRVAQDMGVWDGPGGVALGLVAEVRRLSNIVAPGPGGWAVVPLEVAATNGSMSPEEVSEVENILVYFTVVSRMVKRSELGKVLSLFVGLWNARTTSSNATEFAASLRTSTESGTSTPSTAAPGTPAPPPVDPPTGTIQRPGRSPEAFSLPS